MALVPFANRDNGIMSRVFYYDDETGALTIETKFNQGRILGTLEQNQQDAHEFRPHGGETFRKVAEIPPDVAEMFASEKGIDLYTDEGMDAFIAAILNDPDYAYLKTVPSTYRIKPQE